MSVPDRFDATACPVSGQGAPRSDLAGDLDVPAVPAVPAVGGRRSVLTWPVPIHAGAILVAAYASAQPGGVGKQPPVTGLARWGLRQWRPGRPSFSGLVYVISLVLVLWGMRAWWLRSRRAVAAPAPEGAAACP